ncbi:MAG: helix-turn-helix domain-containing protein [bacterium]
MKLISKKVLNDMEYSPEKRVATYSSDKIVFFKPNETLEKEVLFDDLYHFILPLTQQLPIEVDNKKYQVEKRNIFCVNPCQKIRSFSLDNVEPYWSIFIDKKYINGILSNIDQKINIELNNQNYKVDKQFLDIINRFNYETQQPSFGSELVLQCLGTEFIIDVFRHFQNLTASANNIYQADQKRLGKVIEYLWLYFDKNINLDELADLANFSPYHFIRIFKNETGKTPFEYLTDIRIKKAKEMLESRDLRVSEIAYKCGFSSQNHFYITFKKNIGVSPSKYRDMVK